MDLQEHAHPGLRQLESPPLLQQPREGVDVGFHLPGLDGKGADLDVCRRWVQSLEVVDERSVCVCVACTAEERCELALLPFCTSLHPHHPTSLLLKLGL